MFAAEEKKLYMKTMGKLRGNALALLLTVVLAFGMVPVNGLAFAADQGGPSSESATAQPQDTTAETAEPSEQEQGSQKSKGEAQSQESVTEGADATNGVECENNTDKNECR